MATFLPDFGTYYKKMLKIDNLLKDLYAFYKCLRNKPMSCCTPYYRSIRTTVLYLKVGHTSYGFKEVSDYNDYILVCDAQWFIRIWLKPFFNWNLSFSSRKA